MSRAKVKNSSKGKKRQSKKGKAEISTTIDIEGGIKDSEIIIGNDNEIKKTTITNRIQTITNTIVHNTRPRDYIIYTTVFLLLLSCVGYLFWYNNLRYDRTIASGQLNVLIVPFVEKYPWGYGKSDLGWNIAQIFADGMKKSFIESEINTNVKILGPSDKVPTISGFTESQLEDAAETVSEKINSQIVVYGILTKDEYGDSIVSVKFYISSENFGEAQELISDSIVGGLSLGSFRLTGDTVNGADLLAQNEELRDRLDIFSSIINFLGAYLGDDFDRAQKYIEDASNPNLWKDQNGLEVIYLIHGNMEIRRVRLYLAGGNLQKATETIEGSKKYFFLAENTSEQNGNGSYARAYLGLAGAESLAATSAYIINRDPNLIDTNALEKTLEYLKNAEDAEYKPPTADINIKVYYSTAQVNLAYFIKTNEINYLDTAQKYYQLIVDEYSKSKNKRISEYAALSYSGLGHIAYQNKEYEEAAKYFLNAQNITINPSLKAQLLASAGDAYYMLGDSEHALKYYQDALSRKSDLEKAVSEERLNEIEDRINELLKGKGK